MGEIVNRIAQSPLITFRLEQYRPEGERVVLDIKDQLFQGLILREKDFRQFIKTHDWSQYQDQYVAITCSADAIVPLWAYMLLAVQLQPYAKHFVFGSTEALETELYRQALDQIDFSQFEGKPVVVKGCSEVEVPVAVYVEVARRMRPYVKKLSFGEPCSTVPLYRAGS
ncbi:MAG: DUF2480 family protein [Bacteroidetes bacterium]|nr:MAG: DUF2480 family protein [Bacteroidota bacterium]